MKLYKNSGIEVIYVYYAITSPPPLQRWGFWWFSKLKKKIYYYFFFAFKNLRPPPHFKKNATCLLYTHKRTFKTRYSTMKPMPLFLKSAVHLYLTSKMHVVCFTNPVSCCYYIFMDDQSLVVVRNIVTGATTLTLWNVYHIDLP